MRKRAKGGKGTFRDNPLSRNKEGNNALHLAAERGDIEAIQFLLALGLQRDIFNKKKENPFLVAAKNGHLESCPLLFKLASDKKQKYFFQHLFERNCFFTLMHLHLLTKPKQG